MRCSGFYEPLPRGVTYLLIMIVGKIHRRFCRWRDKGIWKAFLDQLVTELELEWLMIDTTHTHIKVHPHAVGARNGNQDNEHKHAIGVLMFTCWVKAPSVKSQ